MPRLDSRLWSGRRARGGCPRPCPRRRARRGRPRRPSRGSVAPGRPSVQPSTARRVARRAARRAPAELLAAPLRLLGRRSLGVPLRHAAECTAASPAPRRGGTRRSSACACRRTSIRPDCQPPSRSSSRSRNQRNMSIRGCLRANATACVRYAACFEYGTPKILSGRVRLVAVLGDPDPHRSCRRAGRAPSRARRSCRA